jgi:hypothetical protein
VVLDSKAPEELIVSHPPLAVFEVLSPDDLWSEVEDQFEDYERMGIPVKLPVNQKTRSWKLYLHGEFRIVNSPVLIKGEELELEKIETYLKDGNVIPCYLTASARSTSQPRSSRVMIVLGLMFSIRPQSPTLVEMPFQVIILALE